MDPPPSSPEEVMSFLKFSSETIKDTTTAMNQDQGQGQGHSIKMKLIKQGAEARLYSTSFLNQPTLVKERFPKTYRHPALDEKLTKDRLRAELRGILRAKALGIRTPIIYFVDSTRNMIFMEHLLTWVTVHHHIGTLLKYRAEVDPTPKLNTLAHDLGGVIGRLHEAGVVHGDLTTSNVLVNMADEAQVVTPAEGSSRGPSRIALIDFGLSSSEATPEDKGVDLYVLERAISSTHSSIPWLFDLILEGYKGGNSKDSREVMVKLDEIRLRGRKRTMVG